MASTKKIISSIATALFTSILALSLYGCSITADKGASNQPANTASSAVAVENANDGTNTDANTDTDASADAASVLAGDYTAHEWSAEKAPNGYEVQSPAIIEHSPAPGEYVYTGLDSLGRTQAAYACVTGADYQRELSEDREDFGSDADKISGWGHNEKVQLHFPSGKVYNGYFYNRSHLIADSLGGAPTRENLVTGSRFQNVGDNNGGGMGYAETKARDWLADADADEYLYYAVTPVYVGDELVPRSVYVDMKSSDGTIDEHVEVFNVSGDANYAIDYATGEIIGM